MPSPQLETDEAEVLRANQAFYSALESLDVRQMDEMWIHEDWVQCLHPGWDLLTGWEDVRDSWERIFQSTRRLVVAVSRQAAHVVGDVGWVTCVENVTTTYESGFETAVVEAANIFVRRQGRWRVVHHHTTPVPGRVPSGTSSSVQ